MLKVFRKYQKPILVVGGSFLMVAFLMPSTIQSCGSTGANRAVMTVNGKTVRGKDYAQAVGELQSLEKLDPLIAFQLGIRTRSDAGGAPVDPVEHWLLLTTEADATGFVGGAGDGEAWVPELAQQLAIAQAQQRWGNQLAMVLSIYPQLQQELMDQSQQLAQQLPKVIDLVGRETGIGKDGVHRALAKARGALRMMQSFEQAVRPSDRRLVPSAKNDLDAAVISYVAVPAERYLGEVPEPTAEALAAHFEQYKSVTPGTGDLGIGYRQPPSFKIEWIMIDRPAILAKIKADPVEVRKRLLADQAPGGDQTEARARIEAAIRNETADRVMREADKIIRGELAKALRTLEDDGDFKKVPAEWSTTRPTFESMRELVRTGVRDATGIEIDAPPVESRAAAWTPVSDLTSLGPIGNASLRRADREVFLSQILLGTRELLTEGQSSPIRVQVGVPCMDAVDDRSNSRYYFTVLAARAESDPENLDEVRAKVAENVKKLDAFARLRARESELLDLARATGLEAVADPPAESVLVTVRPALLKTDARVTRQTMSPVDPDVQDEAFRAAVMGAARALDPLVPLDPASAGARTLAVAIPRSQSLVIARVDGFLPLTIEEFRLRDRLLVQDFRGRAFRAAGDNPFTLERLIKRMNVKFAGQTDPVAPAATTLPTTTPDGTSSPAPTPAG